MAIEELTFTRAAFFIKIAEEEVEPEGEAESNRTYYKCNSACKTKRKTGSNRGCPCRTANLSCVTGKCKCGTSRKPCANMVRVFFV